jgi:hypothetical protein
VITKNQRWGTEHDFPSTISLWWQEVKALSISGRGGSPEFPVIFFVFENPQVSCGRPQEKIAVIDGQGELEKDTPKDTPKDDQEGMAYHQVFC